MIATVDARREGRWWVLQCREVPGAISQVARLDQAAGTIREAVAWVARVNEVDVEVTVVPHLPSSVDEHVRESQRLREAAAEANKRSALEMRAAALDLAQAGLSVRDVGQVLNVSYQRAQQLLTEARKLKAAAH